MSKIAFIFPGQGSQYVEMGKEFYEKFNESKEIFEIANNVLGFDLIDICFNDSENKLNLTKITQPAILTVSVAILEALKKYNITPSATAGLSLGEYSALVCSGSLDYGTAVKLVHKRGTYMQEAVPIGVGGMVALIGMDRENVIKMCDDISRTHGILEPANFNCPAQIVVGGEMKAIDEVCEKASEYGAKRAVKLAVSAPFHTSMLKPAGDKLKKDLANIEFKDLQLPVIANVTSEYISNENEIASLLEKQVYNSILWEDSIRRLINDGYDTFIEIGPGKSLCGFMKKIDKSVKAYNIENIKTLENVLSKLEVNY